MRHLGSIVLSIIFAPIIYLLVGIGVYRVASAGTGSDINWTDAGIGIGAVVVAGALVAILTMTKLSPLGPVIAGLLFLLAQAYALVDLTSLVKLLGDSVLGNSGAAEVPLDGIALLLAIPLIATIFFPRKWRGKDKVPAAVYPAYGQPAAGQPAASAYGQQAPAYGQQASAYGQPAGAPTYAAPTSAAPSYAPAPAYGPTYTTPDSPAQGYGAPGSPSPASSMPPQTYGSTPAPMTYGTPDTPAAPVSSPPPQTYGSAPAPMTYGTPDAPAAPVSSPPPSYSAPEPAAQPTYAPPPPPTYSAPAPGVTYGSPIPSAPTYPAPDATAVVAPSPTDDDPADRGRPFDGPPANR